MHFVLELNQQLRGVIKNERTDRKGGGSPVGPDHKQM